MADTQAMTIAKDTLIDIELPQSPGMDWVGGLLMLGWGLLAVLFVLLLGLIVWFFWRRAQLYWRLSRLKKALTESSTEKGALQIYQALQIAKQSGLLGSEVELQLKEAIDQACFGRQTVSRETLVSLIQVFQAELKAAAPSVKEGLLILPTSAWNGLKRLGAKRIKRTKPPQVMRGDLK